MQRVGTFADDLDVIDMRPVTNKQLKRGIDLIFAACRSFVTFHEHDPRPALDDDQRAHEARRGFVRSCENEMERPFDRGVGGDPDHRAVPHQRGIERDGDIARWGEFPEMRGQHRRGARKRVGQRSYLEAGLQSREVRQFRHERAGDENQPTGSEIAEERARGFGEAFAAVSGGLASGFASRMSARRSVYFQSSTRPFGRPSRANTRKPPRVVRRSSPRRANAAAPVQKHAPGRFRRRT